MVAAAGNQGTLGSSAITRHPWVIPVVACDLRGRPMNDSNLGGSIGRRGLRAPGDGITSLGAEGQPLTLGGTSVAAPFVTGATALLWSEFPSATAAQIKLAVTQASTPRRASVVPPLLDAAAAYQHPVDSECEEVNSMTKASEQQETHETRANARLTGCACPDSSPTRRSGLAMPSSERLRILGSGPAEAANAGRPRSTAGWCSPGDIRVRSVTDARCHGLPLRRSNMPEQPETTEHSALANGPERVTRRHASCLRKSAAVRRSLRRREAEPVVAERRRR